MHLSAFEKKVWLNTTPGRVDFIVNGSKFASYRRDCSLLPGFTALYAPNESPLTSCGDSSLAVWMDHPNISGSNCSLELGRVVESNITLRRGPYSVGLLQYCDWFGENRQLLLTDSRCYSVKVGPAQGVMMDIIHTLTPADSTSVVIGKAELDLLKLRLTSALCNGYTSQIINSIGDTGLEGIHNSQAEWVNAMGHLDGDTCGLLLLDHPYNPYHPSRWATTHNGTISPCPILWNGNEGVINRPLTLRYRLHTYSGYVGSGWCSRLFKEYAREPIKSTE